MGAALLSFHLEREHEPPPKSRTRAAILSFNLERRRMEPQEIRQKSSNSHCQHQKANDRIQSHAYAHAYDYLHKTIIYAVLMLLSIGDPTARRETFRVSTTGAFS